MLRRRGREQLEFFVCGSMRDLVPDDDVLARVDRVLDLSWLHEEVAKVYSSGVGRPPIDPEAAVRLMLAGFLLGIVHDRRLMREAKVNLAIRWFAGFGLNERLPDHSSLTRIRRRWGAERFRRIFERTLRACVAKGEIVHVDASLTRSASCWKSRSPPATLARMGQALELAPTPPKEPDRARLADLIARRNDLGGLIRAEKNRATMARDPWISRQIARILRVLERNLAAVETEIAALLAACKRLNEEARRLRSTPGVGPLVSAVLVARLPELGRLDRRRISALAGLAPHARDSGLSRGERQIWGGRAEVRRAPYLAAFVASGRDPRFKAYRHRLQAARKPSKVAITACARKLLTILKGTARSRDDYRKPA